MVVRKAVHVARHMQVTILGVVENMSYLECPDTGKRHEIFGPSHSDAVAQTAEAPILGRLPLDPHLTHLADTGKIEGYEHAACAELVAAFVEAMPAPEEVPQPAWATVKT
jgi:hypothetical protein